MSSKSSLQLRGFKGNDLEVYRLQPHPAVYLSFAHRCKTFNQVDFERKQLRIKEFTKKLRGGGSFKGAFVPGEKSDVEYFWLYPIRVPQRFESTKTAVKALLKIGIEASQVTSQLTVLGSEENSTPKTYEEFNRHIYLPVHMMASQRELTKILKILEEKKFYS